MKSGTNYLYASRAVFRMGAGTPDERTSVREATGPEDGVPAEKSVPAQPRT